MATIIDIRGNAAESNTTEHLQRRIAQGLTRQPKSIPTMVLYDDKGLEIFDQITYCKDYYLTDAEIDILKTHSAELVRDYVREGSVLIELGCG
jgi:uncharacterized SAM-dependent methyltransferase